MELRVCTKNRGRLRWIEDQATFVVDPVVEPELSQRSCEEMKGHQWEVPTDDGDGDDDDGDDYYFLSVASFCNKHVKYSSSPPKTGLPHVSDEQTKPQRGPVTSQRSHSQDPNPDSSTVASEALG